MANRIPQNFINDIIARTDIIELIESRVKISKKGQNYSGLCPFHQEKSPSFSVNPQKQFYYCFGCGASGNAIGFLMAYDNMEFLDAITDLASKLNLEIPQESGHSQPSHSEDYALLTKVSEFYQQQLRQSNAAIEYLKSRGLSGKTAKQFAIGFAPDGWDNLMQHVGSSEIDALIRNGLVVKNDQGKCYDRFRNRILFPIHDHRGRVIAFGGRSLGDELPKYINSPETPLFHKNQELYGLDKVLATHRHPKQVIIVEGYMDVVALHQFGICEAVATLGTATNHKHLQKLFRHTQEVVFCFDGDNAGRQAAWKALTTNLAAMRDGVQLKFMFLPSNDDPDTLVRRVGTEGFLQRLKKAQPLSTVFFELIKQEIPLDTPASKAMYAKKASEYLNKMPMGIFRNLMLEMLANEINVYVSDLNTLQNPSNLPQAKQKRAKHTLQNPAQQACALLLQEPKLCQHTPQIEVLSNISLPHVPLLVKLVTAFQAQPNLSVGELLAGLENEPESQEVARLAARRLPFATSAMLAEYEGAIKRIIENYQEVETDQLIAKAKLHELSPEEKKNLALLLTQRHKDLI